MKNLRTRPTKQTFQKTNRLLDDFFKVDEYRGRFELYNGDMSSEQRLLVFERGDSVAALLYDPSNAEVILVEQFRLPTVGIKRDGGWILELPAGILQETETARESMLREFHEETGYQPSELIPISTFFVSPGGSSERIHLFYAEVRRTQQVDDGGGVKEDGEDIRLVRLPIAEFYAKLRNNEFQDAKLIVAAYWLKDRLEALSTNSAAGQRKSLRRLKMPVRKYWFGISSEPTKYVGYITGDIREVTDVDVWVNPLASDMLLDKFTDKTVSAAIRAGGAERFRDGKIKTDLIGDELRRKLAGRIYVDPGNYVATSAGGLERPNRVRQLIHVSTAHGEIGEPPRADLVTIEKCIDNVLRFIDGENRFSSVLIPMLGTGQGGLRVKSIAPMLLEKAIAFLRDNPRSRLKTIYLLGYSEIDADEVAFAFSMREAQLEEFAEPQAPGSPDRDHVPRQSAQPPEVLST
ncbi:MAG: NUDIX domain-containing protein [Hyphomicrobium sp.]|jgi:ADP-ribose pyrophosphatase